MLPITLLSKRALLMTASLLAAAVPITARAQDNIENGGQITGQNNEPRQADDFHNDEGIVVTAPYLERFDLLAGTSVLSGETLSEKARGQIGDVLTSLPGVSATSFSPGASRPVLRGYQGNRVAVLTNGIGNIDASNTSADHAVTIDSLTTERVEILRGPAVLLFGGQAVGGAVNVIDKRIPRAVPAEAIHIDALLGYGTAAKDASAGASADIRLSDRFVAHIDGSYRDSDDLRSGGFILAPGLRAEAQAAGAGALALSRGAIPNSAVKTWTFGSGAAFINDGGNLGVSFNVYDTNYGIPARPSAPFTDPEETVSIDLRQYRFDLSGGVNLGEGFFEKLTLRAGFADYTHTEFEGDEVGTIFNSEAIEARAELVQTSKPNWKGASGVQYQTRDFEAIGAEAFVPPYQGQQWGVFTLQEWKLGAVELELSGRVDQVSLRALSIGQEADFTNLSGALGLGYLTGPVKLGVNISRTGRAPSAEELFSNGPHIATQAFEIGNVNLRSERAWNGEIYARYDGQGVGINATVYTNRFDRFIYEIETGEIEDGLPVFQYTQADADIWGIEFQANAKLGTVAGFNLNIDGVADYTRAKITNGGGNIPRIPPLRLLGGVALASDALDVRAELEWSDRQSKITTFETATDGFTFVNAIATWRPFGRDKNIALIASANNIFDVEGRRAASFTKDYTPLSGRDFRLAARFSF